MELLIELVILGTTLYCQGLSTLLFLLHICAIQHHGYPVSLLYASVFQSASFPPDV